MSLQRRAVSTKASSWCKTKSQIYKFGIRWTIYNFSFQGRRPGDVLISKEFAALEKPELRWRIKLYPQGESVDVHEHVSVYLSPNGEARARYKIAIIDQEGDEGYAFFPNIVRTFAKENGWGSRKYINRQYLLERSNIWLPNDTLTLLCEVEMLGNVTSAGGGTPQYSFPIEDTLGHDLEKLVNSGILSDVIFEVQGREIVGHKVILAARSPIFESMFLHETKSPQRIVIDDVDYEAFSELLYFIYTEKLSEAVSSGGRITQCLLAAADKFGIQALKMICEHSLSRSLRADNAIEILTLADNHKATYLRNLVVNYIACHIAEVMKAPGWKEMTSEMLEEVICTLAIDEIPPAKRQRKL